MEFLQKSLTFGKYASITAAVGYCTFRYAKYKFFSILVEKRKEEQKQAPLIASFNSFEEDVLFILETQLPQHRQRIWEIFNVEQITSQLKLRPVEKRTLWEKMKTCALGRLFASIYISCLSATFVRILVGVIARYEYTDIVQKLSGNETKSVSDDIKKRILTMTWCMLNDNLDEIILGVNFIGEIPLNQQFDYFNTLEMLKRVKDVPLINVLPKEGEENKVLEENGISPDVDADKKFMILLSEVRDFVESPDFTNVFRCLVDGVLDQIGEEMKSVFFEADGRLSKQLNLAGLLPFISKTAGKIMTSDGSYFKVLKV